MKKGKREDEEPKGSGIEEKRITIMIITPLPPLKKKKKYKETRKRYKKDTKN